MRWRTIVLGLALTLALPAAAQTDPVHLEPPLPVNQGTVEASGALVMVEEGQGSLAASAGSGSLVVWEERTPCFSQNPDSCIGSSETSRTASSLEGASLTVTPRDGDTHRTIAEFAEEGRFSASAGQAELGVRSEAQPVSLTGGGPDDVDETELPRGLTFDAEDANVVLEGDLVLRSTGSHVTVETNDSEQARDVVTGLSWEEGEDGFTYRTLRLAKASFQGALTSTWEGPVHASPRLPASLVADSAEVNVTEGQLEHANATTGPATIEDLEATLAGIAWQDEGGHLVVEQGTQPVSPAQAPSEEGLSRTSIVGASGAAAVAVLAAAYYWPRLSWLGTAVLLPLYSRIEKDELFENDTREALYEHVKQDPGIHAHALSEEVDIGWGTTVYHLRRLERNGFVTSEKRGRYRRFFPASGFVERHREVLSVLQNETTNDIAALVREQPGLNQSAICEKLDISPSLANWHLNRLIDADLVDRERRGRTVHYTPGEAWETLEKGAELELGDVLEDVQADAQAA